MNFTQKYVFHNNADNIPELFMLEQSLCGKVEQVQISLWKLLSMNDIFLLSIVSKIIPHISFSREYLAF